MEGRIGWQVCRGNRLPPNQVVKGVPLEVIALGGEEKGLRFRVDREPRQVVRQLIRNYGGERNHPPTRRSLQRASKHLTTVNDLDLGFDCYLPLKKSDVRQAHAESLTLA